MAEAHLSAHVKRSVKESQGQKIISGIPKLKPKWGRLAASSGERNADGEKEKRREEEKELGEYGKEVDSEPSLYYS